MCHKFIEVRHRLYDNGLAANARKTGSLHRKWETLFLKCYRHFYADVLKEDLTAQNAKELAAKETELRMLKSRLAQLAEPREMAKLLPPRVGRLLGRALVVAKARMVQTGADGLEARALLAALRPAGGAAAAAAAAQQQRKGSGGSSGSWGNGAGGAGARATVAQMAAFTAHLEASGLELVDCPSAGNNCGYYAVLSQVHGIPPSAAHRQAAALVSDSREMIADVLEHHAGVEAVAPTGRRTWTDAICALSGRRTTGAAGGPAVEEVVRQHLDGVRRDAPMTHVELAVLTQLLEHSNVLLTIYNPTYDPHRGYCSVQSDAAPAVNATHVRVANVQAGGAGELNHWNVVQPRGGPGGPAAGGAGGGGGLTTPSPNARRQASPAAGDDPGAPIAKRLRSSNS